MNITKEKIVDWVCKSIYPMATEDGELSEIIKACLNDLSPKWVSVDDRLPDKWEEVRIYPAFDDDRHGIDLGQRDSDGEWCIYVYDSFDSYKTPWNVTHWMPLEEPPK